MTFSVSRRHRVLRWSMFGVGIVLALLTAAAAVNAHYAYYPYLGNLWGETGSEVVSEEALRRGPDCAQVPAQGTVTPVQVPATASGFQADAGKPVWVYLPPAWCRSDDTRYPVVLLLHGAPSAEGGRDWLAGMEGARWADELAAAHDGKAPVLVMPDVGSPSDTECVDSAKFGKVETWLTEDIPGWLRGWDVTRGRITDPGAGWAVGGFSMGGTCAFMLGTGHPDLWQTIGDYGGDYFGVGDGDVSEEQQRRMTIRDLFDGDPAPFDAHEPSAVLKTRRFDGSAAWFGVGGGDQGTLRQLRRYRDDAAAAGMQTCWQVVPDQDHTFLAWKPAFRDSLPWIAARTGLVPMTPEIVASCRQP